MCEKTIADLHFVMETLNLRTHLALAPPPEEWEPDILRNEVPTVILHLKRNKVVGVDEIPMEIFQVMGEVAVQIPCVAKYGKMRHSHQNRSHPFSIQVCQEDIQDDARCRNSSTSTTDEIKKIRRLYLSKWKEHL